MTYSDATRDLWSVYSPILLSLGLLGNGLSLAVTSRGAMRGIASSRYLKAIAIADNGSLLFGLLPKWLQHRFSIDVTTLNDFLCKTRNFLFYTSQDSSIWIICAFTFDRFLVVVFPLRRAVIRATRRVRLSIATVVLLAVLKNSTIFWSRAVVTTTVQTAGSGSGNPTGSDSGDGNETGSSYQKLCTNPSTSSAHFDNYIRPWIVFVTVHCLPFLFLIACNVAIVREIVKVRYASLSFGASGGSKGRVARMTGLCLAVSLTFLVLEFPSTVLLIGRPYWTGSPTEAPTEGEHVAVNNSAATKGNNGIPQGTNITSKERYSLLENPSISDGKHNIRGSTNTLEGRYNLLETTISPDKRMMPLETNSTSDEEHTIPEDTSTSDDERYKFFEAIASLLNYANCAVNFYLYCFAGARFRTEFFSMITLDKSRKYLRMKFHRNRAAAAAVNHRQKVLVRRQTDAQLIDTRFIHRTYDDSALQEVESEISRPRSSTM